MKTRKSRRFEARIDPESDDIIARAADLTGESKSAFIVKSARRAADKVLAQQDNSGISQATFDELVAAITTAVLQELRPGR